MSDERLIKVLREAYQIEVEGTVFYRNAASAVDGQEARDIFIYLAEQEKVHQKTLFEQIKLLDAGKEMDLTGFKGISAEDRSAFFADSMRSMKEPGQSEASALHAGLLLERNSVQFYKSAAENSQDPKERELYTALRDWELVHVRTLEAAYNEVKERIWADNRFAPF
jgi:rubrerythrin